MAKCGHAGEKKPHYKNTNKTNYHLKLCTFFCLSCPSATFALWHGSFEPHECRAVAWFFPTGGHYRECQRAVPFRRVWGYPPPEKFHIWRLQKLTSNKCEKASVFSAYILQVFTSEVLLI